jgi:hypothetical protein
MSGHPGQVETERLPLVPWSDQYFDEFARICADGDLMHFISGGEPLSRQNVEQILRRTSCSCRTNTGGVPIVLT